MSSPFLLQLEQLVAQKGSLAEKQLIQRWQHELDRFLAPATRSLLNKHLILEIGIEDTLTLKLNLKPNTMRATETLIYMMEDSPHLKHWGEYVLNHQPRFACGIKITAEFCSRELYIYPGNHEFFAKQLPDNLFTQSLLSIKPLFVGIDDHRGYSMYFNATDTGWIDALQKELGLESWHTRQLWAWQQLRFDGQQLLAGKTALELHPLQVQTLSRFISHYPFPYFRYLIPLRQQRNGNFGRDPVTGRFALYATVN